MPTENEGRVQSFGTESQSLLEQWTANMAGLAEKLDNDKLTVDDLVKSWASTTKLAFQGWSLLFSTGGVPTTKSAPGSGGAEPPAVSAFFPVALNPAVAGTLVLQVLGPLKADVGGHEVPVSEISFKPPELGAGERSFRIQFPKGTHPKLIYRGKVEVRRAAGQPVLKTIDVSVEVS